MSDLKEIRNKINQIDKQMAVRRACSRMTCPK